MVTEILFGVGSIFAIASLLGPLRRVCQGGTVWCARIYCCTSRVAMGLNPPTSTGSNQTKKQYLVPVVVQSLLSPTPLTFSVAAGLACRPNPLCMYVPSRVVVINHATHTLRTYAPCIHFPFRGFTRGYDEEHSQSAHAVARLASNKRHADNATPQQKWYCHKTR